MLTLAFGDSDTQLPRDVGRPTDPMHWLPANATKEERVAFEDRWRDEVKTYRDLE